MEYFGREKLKELLEEPDGTAVSIYLPTARAGSEAEGDRLRFRAALERAVELAAAEEDGSGPSAELDELAELIDDREFWRYQSDGLAVFAARGFIRIYRMPTSLPELVVAAPTFHTRPLIDLLQAPDRYWVLGLSREKVRLWEGTAGGASPLDLRTLPEDMIDALGFEFERDPEFVHRRKAGPSRGERGRGGHQPTFHGHGAEHEETEAELRRFFRKVDDGLRAFLADEIGPVVLAAVQEYHPVYRSLSRLDNLAEEGIQASVTEWSANRIHEAAWPIAKEAALDKVDEALELWERAYGQGKGEMDVANVARLAIAGRIRLLLTERDRRIWGTLDRGTGAVEVLREGGDDPGNHAVELLDELAELVLRRGGRALVLSPERMPTDTGVAAVLR